MSDRQPNASYTIFAKIEAWSGLSPDGAAKVAVILPSFITTTL